MPQQQPLDLHQQELINIIKVAHQTLAIARKTRTRELARRVAEAKLQMEREFEQAQIRIKEELDAELVAHETNLDNALIAAYDNGVPIRRMALDGFGNRYDGGVQQLLVKLRDDGRLGNRTDWQRNAGERIQPEVVFPEPVNVDEILAEAATIKEPTFTALDEPLVLVEPDKRGKNGVTAPAVRLEFDYRDPWFKQIARNARPGTQYKNATFCTLYRHPASGVLTVHESRETGAITWDHPVARWVKDHPTEALDGYRTALQSAVEYRDTRLRGQEETSTDADD
jgi:hypothetical protein